MTYDERARGGTVAILGAGRVGTAIARAALAAGYDVDIAASGPPDAIDLLVDFVAPGARARSAAAAAESADLVVLAIPLHKWRTLDPGSLAGRIVIDAMNYWPSADGTLSEFEHPNDTSSEVVARHLPDARVAKTLNHIAYQEIDIDGSPSGAPGRRALGIASDDEAAADVVARFLDRIGYDAVHVGALARSGTLEPGAPAFGTRMSAQELQNETSATAVLAQGAH